MPTEYQIYPDSSESYPLVKPSQMTLSHLDPFTNYTITLYAFNDAGSSPRITVVEQTYPAGKLNSLLLNYIYILVVENQIYCTADLQSIILLYRDLFEEPYFYPF